MNVEIVAEAALFPEKEYIKGIFVTVWERGERICRSMPRKFILCAIFFFFLRLIINRESSSKVKKKRKKESDKHLECFTYYLVSNRKKAFFTFKNKSLCTMYSIFNEIYSFFRILLCIREGLGLVRSKIELDWVSSSSIKNYVSSEESH
jgi:hypothetical protein